MMKKIKTLTSLLKHNPLQQIKKVHTLYTCTITYCVSLGERESAFCALISWLENLDSVLVSELN